jgi:hypothetical protein
LQPGLPDGIFSNQKSQFGLILEALAMEDVGIFYVHLGYFTAIWYILWSFGIFYGHLVYFVVIWYIFPVFFPEIWQTWLQQLSFLCRLHLPQLEPVRGAADQPGRCTRRGQEEVPPTVHPRPSGQESGARSWVRVPPGANATIVSYNASAVKNYNSTSSLVRFESKSIFFYFENTL